MTELAERTWEAKVHEPVRLLFAGRLLASKGVSTLLAALRSLESRRIPARVDFIGRGEERDACVEAAAACRTVRISVLEPVPYGRSFFDLLQRYHALLVPSLTEEQPRIVFDGSSQAVPVIASDTRGIRPYVRPGETGWIVPRATRRLSPRRSSARTGAAKEFRTMGLAALRASRGLTHQAMHRWRSRLIRDYLT
jgi:glycosyltransferase involved in cell wall biosynthesis